MFLYTFTLANGEEATGYDAYQVWLDLGCPHSYEEWADEALDGVVLFPFSPSNVTYLFGEDYVNYYVLEDQYDIRNKKLRD